MKKKERIFIGIIPFILTFLIIFSLNLDILPYHDTSIDLSVVKGCVTLPKGNSNEEKIFLLSGEFYFVSNKFNALKNGNVNTFAQVPGSLEKTTGSKFGYGSYGLHIEGLNPELIYSIRAPHAFSSCSIVINGREDGHQGVVGTSSDSEVPSNGTSESLFRPKKDGSVDIVFNVSNFHRRKYGFFSKIILGELNKARKMFRTNLIFNASIFASSLTVAIFLFVLFFFYKQARFVIWFAFASSTIAIRGLFFYPHLAAYMFPDMNWHISFIIRYISFPLPILFFTIFLKQALKVCYKIPYAVILTVTILYALSITILSPNVSGYVLKYYQVFSAFCILYNLIVLFHALIRKQALAKWIFFGSVILMAIGIYDILVAINYIHGNYFLPVGAFMSILFLSVMILRMYSNSITKIEELREKSKEMNNALVRFVPKELVRLLHKKSIKELEVGEHVELKMPLLSMDIRSFTKTSEQLSPQEVFDFLNNYFALIVPIVQEHNGIILKYLGDGFFALFPDGAFSAVDCAVKMQNILKEQDVMKNEKHLHAGIGIDLGNMLLATVGNKSRMESIIISNAYKNAENMQEMTKKYNSSIIISSSVFDNLDANRKCFIRPVQLVKNKKKEHALIYEVYTSDDDEVRLLKTKSQGYLIEAFRAISAYNLKMAYVAFKSALSIYPQDPVATMYIEYFNKKKA